MVARQETMIKLDISQRENKQCYRGIWIKFKRHNHWLTAWKMELAVYSYFTHQSSGGVLTQPFGAIKFHEALIGVSSAGT